MAHYGMLRDYRFSESAEDIRGSAIYGYDDEKLGKIDDVIFDHSTGDIRYLIVDTGGWLKSKKFVVPADKVAPSTDHVDDYSVDLNKSQIESFPPYDENHVAYPDRWNDYETRYRAVWTTSPVQHQQGSERNITPETVSKQGTRHTALGERWQSFEDRLRHDRDRIVSSCSVCGTSKQRKVG